MVLDALRGYVQLASGMTEVSRKKAEKAAKALLKQTGADTLTTKVSDLADEIVATSKSNRQLLQAIVTNEVEGAVARLGFVRSEEVAALTRRVKVLEGELAEARDAAAPVPSDEPAEAPEEAVDDPFADDEPEPAAKKVAAKKVPAKKVAAKKAVKKTPVKKVAAKKTPAKKVPAKKAPAETTAKKV
jgi:hypothetical protein